MANTDPDLIHPDAQIVVQSPSDRHPVDGHWWNEYVRKTKSAGLALVNRIVEVIDDAGQQIPGFEKTPPPAAAPQDVPPVAVEQAPAGLDVHPGDPV